jgi:hypothetical protein
MGRLTPAGTGMPRYINTHVKREFLPLFNKPVDEEAAS